MGSLGQLSGPLRRIGPGGALLAGLTALVALAAFSSGGIGVGEEARIGIATGILLGITAVAASARVLSVPRDGAIWVAVLMLLLLAVWAYLGIGSSSLPDETWRYVNRTLGYTAVLALALIAGKSLSRASEKTAFAIAGVSLLVALYALGGKVVPFLGLDHTDQFARLRAPIGYWNALGLFIALGTPVLIWLGAERDRATSVRLWSMTALAVAITAGALTVSRGAIIAYLVGTAVMVAGGPRRFTRLAVAVLPAMAVIPAAWFGLNSGDLTTDAVKLSERVPEGLILGALLIGGVLVMRWAAWRVLPAAQRLDRDPHRSREAWRRIRRASLVAGALVFLVLLFSDRGISGSIRDVFDDSARIQRADANDSSRLLSSSGSGRFEWWGEALGGWWDKPMRGWGAGSFRVVHLAYRDQPLGVEKAHSVPLQFLSDVGLVGFALAGSGLGLLFLAAYVAVRRADGADRAARLALLAMGSAWAVHGLVDWDWDIPAVTLPVLIALGVASVPRHGKPGSPREEKSLPLPIGPGRAVALSAAGALVASLIAISAWLPAKSDDLRVEALRAAAVSRDDPAQLKEAGALADLAHRLDGLSVEPLFAASTIAGRRDRPREAFELLAEAARLQPDNPFVWRRLLNFQTGVGDRRLLDETVANALRTDPLAGRIGLVASLVLFQTPPEDSPTAAGTPLGKVTVLPAGGLRPAAPVATPSAPPASPAPETVAPGTAITPPGQ